MSKSKILILEDFLKREIKDILKNTKFGKFKENVFFDDEMPFDTKPEDMYLYMHIDVREVSRNFGEYVYGLSFSYIINELSARRKLYALEEIVDREFLRRLKNQNSSHIWFLEPVKTGLEKIDGGIETTTQISSSYIIKTYFGDKQ